MDAEAIYAEQIGYDPPDFESCHSLAGEQGAHELAARHAMMLGARDALTEKACMPSANLRGVSKATALLISAADSRAMHGWRHGMTLGGAEAEPKMLSLRIDQDLKVHRQQGEWIHRAGAGGYPGPRSPQHLKTLGRCSSGLQGQGARLWVAAQPAIWCAAIPCSVAFMARVVQHFRLMGVAKPACACMPHRRAIWQAHWDGWGVCCSCCPPASASKVKSRGGQRCEFRRTQLVCTLGGAAWRVSTNWCLGPGGAPTPALGIRFCNVHCRRKSP